MAVAIYVRKSTDREDHQVQSLEDQLTSLRKLAERESLEIEREIIEAKSAKEPGTRPEFGRLMADISSGRIEGVLVWQINRLARNMVDGGMVSHLLQSGKLRFIKTPDKTYHPEDSALLMAIETGMATSFIQDLRRNVRRGMEGKARRGWFPGPAPFGYVNNRLTREIEPDPQRFHILRQAWEMLASGGMTVADVRRQMAELGITDASGKSGMTNGTAYRMFRNRFYTGELPYGGEWLPGKHQPMVSKADFGRVQAGLSRAPKSKDVELKHPYAGVFTCPNCGCAVTAETKVKRFKTTGTERRYTYYRCTGAKGCSKMAVTGERLDEAMHALFEAFRTDPVIEQWMRSQLKLSAERASIEDATSIADHARSVEGLKRRLERLTELRIADELCADDFAAMRTLALGELHEAQDRLMEAKQLGSSVDADVTRKIDVLESARGWTTMATTAKRAFIRTLSEKSFLTLERLEFWVDPTLLKIALIEPGEISFQGPKQGDLSLSFSNWYAFWDHIRKEEASKILRKSEEKPKSRIVVELSPMGGGPPRVILRPDGPCADVAERAGPGHPEDDLPTST